MAGNLAIEIVSIRSLQKILQQIEEDLNSYKYQQEDYSERLGNFLREAEERYGDEKWFKELSLENISKEKKKKKGKVNNWVIFKSLELTSSVQGEAEIMFETLQALIKKIRELEDAKEAIEELRNVGLGNEVIYNCLIQNGVITKVVLKSVDADEMTKFTYNVGFSKLQAVQ
jgi:hypothetical protein